MAEAAASTGSFKQDLIEAHNRLLDLSFLPEKAENWINLQVETRWKNLLEKFPQAEERIGAIWQAIGKLKQSLYIGKDPEIIRLYDKMPEDLKKEWVDLIYRDSDRFDPVMLDSLIKILANAAIVVPSREKSRKALIQLKALAENMNQLERNTNFLLRQVLDGMIKQIARRRAPLHERFIIRCLTRVSVTTARITSHTRIGADLTRLSKGFLFENWGMIYRAPRAVLLVGN